MPPLCRANLLSSTTLAGVFVAYVASLAAVALNTPNARTHVAQLLTQGVNTLAFVVVLVLIRAFNGRAAIDACSATGASWVVPLALLGVLVGNLVARLIVGSRLTPEQNSKAKYTRWDMAASFVGTLVVVRELYYASVPRMRGRTVVFSLLLMFSLPLLGLVQRLAGRSTSPDHAVLRRAVEVSRAAYQSYERPEDQDSRVVSADNANRLYVGFAGTENKEDVRVDANVADVELPAEWLGPARPPVLPRAHAGFVRLYARIRPRVWDLVSSAGKDVNVVCCGHSLGGALATLAALDLASAGGGRPVTLVSFGAPSLGDNNFVKLFDDRVSTAVRVVNPFDPVVRSLNAQFSHTKGQYVVTSLTRDLSPLRAHSLSTYDVALSRPAWARILGIFLPTVVLLLLLLVLLLVTRFRV